MHAQADEQVAAQRTNDTTDAIKPCIEILISIAVENVLSNMIRLLSKRQAVFLVLS